MDEVRRQLAAEMNRERKRRRMNWVEVATAAGMTQQNLLRIRKGEISVTEDAAYGIERALGWPEGYIDRLLGRAGDPTVDLAATEAEIERRMILIRRHYGREMMLRAAQRIAEISDGEFNRLSDADDPAVAERYQN